MDSVAEFERREQEALGDLNEDLNIFPADGELCLSLVNLEVTGQSAQHESGYVMLNGVSESQDEPQPNLNPSTPENILGEEKEESEGDVKETLRPLGDDNAVDGWRKEFVERIQKRDEEEKRELADLLANATKVRFIY